MAASLVRGNSISMAGYSRPITYGQPVQLAVQFDSKGGAIWTRDILFYFLFVAFFRARRFARISSMPVGHLKTLCFIPFFLKFWLVRPWRRHSPRKVQVTRSRCPSKVLVISWQCLGAVCSPSPSPPAHWHPPRAPPSRYLTLLRPSSYCFSLYFRHSHIIKIFFL